MNSFFSTQLGKRSLVISYYLIFLSIYPTLEHFTGPLAFILFLLISPLSFKLSGLLKAYHNDNPDEREKSLINEAHRHAYGILVPTIIVVLIAEKLDSPAWASLVSNFWVLDQITNLWPFTVLAVTLPAAIIMWLEPEPVTDELILKGELA